MKFTSLVYQTAISVYSMLPFKKQLCQAIRLLPVSKEKFYRDLKFKGKFSIEIEGRKLQLLNSGYEVENEIFWKGIKGGWEKVSLITWIELCRSASTIIDVGANTGIYSLIASHINPVATIFAFEPSQKMFEKLNQNIKLNGFSNITPLPVAISNRNGEAAFFDFASEHQYSASLNKDMPVGEIPKVEVKVPVITLDTFLEDKHIKSIDLVKIDVEMHEPEVLEGFYKRLKTSMPTMIIEILSDEMGTRIEKQLQGLGYLYFNMDEIHPPRNTAHLSKSNGYNFLICREEVAKQLQLI